MGMGIVLYPPLPEHHDFFHQQADLFTIIVIKISGRVSVVEYVPGLGTNRMTSDCLRVLAFSTFIRRYG